MVNARYQEAAIKLQKERAGDDSVAAAASPRSTDFFLRLHSLLPGSWAEERMKWAMGLISRESSLESKHSLSR